MIKVYTQINKKDKINNLKIKEKKKQIINNITMELNPKKELFV
jgi:hypothetical protein